MELRFTARFEQFKNSLQSLEKISDIEWPENQDLFGFIWCGVISKFCITFDLSYKLAKDVLVEYHGITNFAKGSPREILKEAYQANMIHNEKWLEMLSKRNEIVHQYQEYAVVDDWCKRITNEYIPLFQELADYVQGITL